VVCNVRLFESIIAAASIRSSWKDQKDSGEATYGGELQLHLRDQRGSNGGVVYK
jgi:hypothetical protein